MPRDITQVCRPITDMLMSGTLPMSAYQDAREMARWRAAAAREQGRDNAHKENTKC